MANISTIACTEEGNLYAWGNNEYGQLGIGNIGDVQTTPHPVVGINNVKNVYMHDFTTTIAKTEEGKIYAWGNNMGGELGIGSLEEYKTTPQEITEIDNVKDIYEYGGCIIAKIGEGELYAWGYNESGLLGIGSSAEEFQITPQKIEEINNVLEVYIDSINQKGYITIRTEQGKLYTWGRNEYGMLTIGNEIGQSMPVCINEIENFDFYKKSINRVKIFGSDIKYIITDDGRCYLAEIYTGDPS